MRRSDRQTDRRDEKTDAVRDFATAPVIVYTVI